MSTTLPKFAPDAPRTTKRGKLQLDDPGQYGPAMKAIKPQWRRFIHIYLANGGRNATRAYLEAGFGGDAIAAKTNASRILHDERMQAALREETKKMMVGNAPLAQSVVEQILDNPTASAKDKLTAAKMIWDRTGFIAATEHQVKQTVTLNAEQLHAELALFAKELGLDMKQVLGPNFQQPMALIEADFEEVPEGSLEGLEDLV